MKRSDKIDLRGLTLSGLADHLLGIGIPASRAPHLFSWLYQLGSSHIAKLHGFKKEYREKLLASSFVSSLVPAKIEKSKDGTVKYAFVLDDGAVVETVVIPVDGRNTLCVSSQVGCAMGCSFCLTGTMGLKRNLTPSEIVNQVVSVVEHLAQTEKPHTLVREIINNLVFMGMGEPLANYDNLIIALNILMEERGFEFTERRVTISTCGIVPKIEALGRDVKVNLAISLHAGDDKTRNILMPINRKYPIDELLNACRTYPLARKKVILFEYILIDGVNDSSDHAKHLAEKLSGISCRVNLMPFNECAGLPYKCPGNDRILAFQEELRNAGILALVRNSRGADISAACGQLAVGTEKIMKIKTEGI